MQSRAWQVRAKVRPLLAYDQYPYGNNRLQTVLSSNAAQIGNGLLRRLNVSHPAPPITESKP
jgi:hypothetical protein